MRYNLKMQGADLLAFVFCRPLWTDSLLAKRLPAAYLGQDDCTGGSTEFAAHDALWINNHGDSPGPLPACWKTYFVWRWADTGVFPGDQDVMNPKALKRTSGRQPAELRSRMRA
jgi:hypothetical protein